MQERPFEELLREALALPPESRIRLAVELMGSVESLSDEEKDHVWAEEAMAHDRELEARGPYRDLETVLRKVLDRLA